MDSSPRFSWERPASVTSDTSSTGTNWEDEKVLQRPSPACSTDSLISHRSVSWTVDKLADEERIIQSTPSEPPADQGKAAWLFLFGSFWIEALVWGFPFSFGVFQEYYATHEPFSAEFASVPAIGTTASGLMYLLSPLNTFILSRYPITQRIFPAAGVAILALSLFVSSWATTVPHLVMSQGVLYAIGGSMTYCAMIRALDTWFIRRKGMAFGVVLAGNGFAGITVSYVIAAGFSGFGFKTTVRVWSILLVIILGPLLWWQKPRAPEKANTGTSFAFFRSPRFYIPFLATVAQGLGFFLPIIYLPAFAQKVFDANLGLQNGTLTALNGAAVVGCIVAGVLTDRVHISTVYLTTSLGAAIAVFFLWGFSTHASVLIIFAIAYGFFAGSYSTAWTGTIVDLQKSLGTDAVDGGFVYGMLLFARGFGNVISGPLSSALVASPISDAAAAYGTQYGPLLGLTGVTAILGGIAFTTRWLRR